MKYVAPSVGETAFNCPHCGALAKQFWYSLIADERDQKNPLPTRIFEAAEGDWDFADVQDEEFRARLVSWAKKMKLARPFLERNEQSNYSNINIHNADVSRCFNCDDIAIWIFDRMAYPISGEAPPVNPDLPAEIALDYEEASSILDLSPRGASALIRLAIQKLCKELGEPGKNINTDIASLVQKGLDSRVQKALDIVRVVGNESVHPGQIDLRDDRSTAESLFRLLNLIVEKMISEPKHVDEVYALLPENNRKAIEERDRKK